VRGRHSTTKKLVATDLSRSPFVIHLCFREKCMPCHGDCQSCNASWNSISQDWGVRFPIAGNYNDRRRLQTRQPSALSQAKTRHRIRGAGRQALSLQSKSNRGCRTRLLRRTQIAAIRVSCGRGCRRSAWETLPAPLRASTYWTGCVGANWTTIRETG
jgi:hypothetical protein